MAKKIVANDIDDKPLLDGYDNYIVYSDMEDHINLNYAHVTHFKQLDVQYPNSKFILNIRDVENWIKSRNNHMDGKYAEYLCYRLEINRDVLNDLWREEFSKKWEQISSQGFDLTFKRMWNFYLSYCEAGFKSKNIDLIQFSLSNK